MPDIGRIDLAQIADFRIGALLIRPSIRQLMHDDGQSDVLEPRVMQVLVALAQADGAILTRDELTQSCWENRVVGEDAINRVISRLRRVTDGIGREQFHVETITKVGYRLLRDGQSEPVAAIESASRPETRATASAAVTPPAGGRRRWIAPVGLLLAAVPLAAGIYWWRDTAPMQRIVQVAPVQVAAGDAAAQLFRQSLSTDLARLVVGSDAALNISDRGVAGGSTEQPDLLVSGRAQTSAGVLHVTATLLAPRDSTILWSRDFTRPAGEIEALRQQVAAQIADVIVCALGSPSLSAKLDLPTLRLYLSGCEKRHEDFAGAAQIFRKVVDRQPDFARGWSQLGAATALAGAWGQVEDRNAAIREASLDADRALALDLRLGQAYFVKAISLRGRERWSERMALLSRGLAFEPDNAQLNNTLAMSLATVGRIRDALPYMQRAVDADPFGPVFVANLSQLLVSDRQESAAAALLDRAQRYWPSSMIFRRSQFELMARTGDAAKAASMLADPVLADAYKPARRATWEAFLTARADPSPARVDAVVGAMNRALSDDSTLGFEFLQELVILGRIDDAFAVANKLRADSIDDEDVWFRGYMAPFRADRRFIPLMAKLGDVAIWQRTGRWPDFCLDRSVVYDCQAEVRRISTARAR
ncbi:MAG: winged helix-turn-helix domain-containing protein [Sphingomonas sp.]